MQNRRIQVPHEKTSSRMTGMRKLPPLRALHAFEAAARHHSFAAAANELGVTPTAISHQIRQLEESCGTKLFQRRPRPLLLTSADDILKIKLMLNNTSGIVNLNPTII